MSADTTDVLEPLEPMRVAMIGLGRMGGPMADHVIGAGHQVRAFDVDATALARRVAVGGVAAGSPAEAASDAQYVGVVVFDDEQATDVVTGDDGVLAEAAPGTVVAIHATVTLDTVRALAAAAAARGVLLLDAGISGGEAGAASGTLVTMVGGPAEALARVRPAMAAFSKEVLHAGPLGAGMALKLARNSVGYAWMTAVHEAMELAHRSGVDVDLLAHTITETGVFEQALVPLGLGGPDPLPDDAPADVRTHLEHTNRLAEKDLDHALHLAGALGADLPVVTGTRRSFHRAVRV